MLHQVYGSVFNPLLTVLMNAFVRQLEYAADRSATAAAAAAASNSTRNSQLATRMTGCFKNWPIHLDASPSSPPAPVPATRTD